MYERVFKTVTILSCILTVAVCVAVQFFPDMYENYVQADEVREWMLTEGDPDSSQDMEESSETDGEAALDNSLIQIQKEELQVITGDAEEELKGQLMLRMSDEIDAASLEIENDYLNQIVYISLDTDIKSFSDAFSIAGSSDHIASLSYYNEEGKGVIALALDKVYETRYEIDTADNAVYLDFIDPHELYDKVVVIDAGHGGRQPGAVMLSTIEKDINLEILLETKKILDQYDNIKVYYTRLSDVNPTLEQRANLANRSDANIFISIHNNSNMSGRFNNQEGTHLLYSQSDKSEYSSARLSAICVRNMSQILGSKNLGLMEADNIYIIRSSEVPVALIEVGYLTNRGELEKLNTKEYRELAAQGIVNSIMEAFEDGF